MNRRTFLHFDAVIAVGSLAATSALAQSKADPEGTTPPPRNWSKPASVTSSEPAAANP